MDDAQRDDAEAFAKHCVERLSQKQAALGSRGVADCERFEADLTAGKLRFYAAGDRLALEADVTPIGTHVSETESWQWAWANKSFPEEVRERSAKLKGAWPGFAERTLELDEAETWRLVALSCEYLNAQGMYDIPTRNARLYVAILDVAERE